MTFVAVALAALLVAGPATAGSYGNKVSTACNVDLTAKAGRAVSAYINVKGNSSNTIHGDVTITVTKDGAARAAARAAGTVVWTKTVHYSGSPLTVTGPVLPNGQYHAAASFSADPGVYLDCQCFQSFRAGAAGMGAGGGNPGLGGLPNTGGPSQWWLFLSFGLLAAGGAAVVASRRQKVLA